MDGESSDRDAARARGRLQVLGIHPVPEPKDPLAGTSPGGNATVNRSPVQSSQKRIVGGQRVGERRIRVGTEAAADQQTPHAAGDAASHPLHLPGLRRWEGTKSLRAMRTPLVDPVQGEGVEVHVQVQGIAEALDVGHGSAVRGLEGPAAAGPPAKRGEERPDEDAQDRLREIGVEGEAVTKTERQRQDPLANGDPGEDRVHEVGGGVGHPPSSAGRAEAASLAGERHQAIVAAVIAMDSKEAAGEDSAI
jgi:hypothetical protein